MRAFAVLFTLALWVLPAAPALALDDSERAAVQAIVRSQADALSHDDAAGAYGYAAPAIQRMFPSPEMFLEMVRRGYAPVYRNRSFDLGELRDSGGIAAIAARIVDLEGVAWDALYTLEKQEDGGWKITSCVLLKAEGQSV